MSGTDDESPDESWSVEFQYQIFANQEEAERFASALLTVVEPVVASVGRVEPGRIGLTSARAGQHDERHSASNAGTLAESWSFEPESGAYTPIYAADQAAFASRRPDVAARQF